MSMHRLAVDISTDMHRHGHGHRQKKVGTTPSSPDCTSMGGGPNRVLDAAPRVVQQGAPGSLCSMFMWFKYDNL